VGGGGWGGGSELSAPQPAWINFNIGAANVRLGFYEGQWGLPAQQQAAGTAYSWEGPRPRAWQAGRGEDDVR
jgi:hypothetical protein